MELHISETESRYFGDLFLCCDVEKTGKVPILKATELFRSANLSNDVIRQIMSLTAIPQTSLHISRKQFYSCLKLIAAHQASLPLRQEIITTNVSLPLPRFSWKDSPTSSIIAATSTSSSSGSGGTIAEANGIVEDGGRLELREWREVRSPDLIELTRESQNDTGNSDQPSTDSEVEPNDSSARESSRRHGGSPEAWSTASDSPTPTNSVAERPWAKGNLWHGLLCEEQRQLLGTEEESSDRHSSDEDNDTDLESIYQITPEQREYYTKQFKTVQPDPNGLLSGHVARVFFEKSRIPVEELRHIWQLCDVTKDGALSLAEFTAAMHLVVLRRNNIPLPSTLPACLMPVLGQTTNAAVLADPPEADLLHLNDDETDNNKPNESEYKRIISVHAQPPVGVPPVVPVTDSTNIFQPFNSTTSTSSASQSSSNSTSSTVVINKPITTSSAAKIHHQNHNITSSNSPPLVPTSLLNNSTRNPNRSISNSPIAGEPATPPKVKADGTKDWNSQQQQQNREWNTNKEWTKFNESPTSNVSSPGLKPVNFDMQRTAQAVVSDPQILHPVPLRVTPVGGVSDATIIDDESSRHLRKTDNLVYDSGVIHVGRDTESSPKQLNQRDSIQTDLRPIQRPQPKKLPSKSIGALPPPPQREISITSDTIGNDVILNNTIQPLSSGTGIHNNNNNSNNKKEPPPLPPPRPHRHARSSSLDLNKLKLNAPMPPEIPPRVSPQMTTQVSCDAQVEGTNTSFADFTHFPESINECKAGDSVEILDGYGNNNIPPPRPTFSSLQSSQRTSAFEVYRKPTPRNSQSPDGSQSTTISSKTTSSDYEKRISIITENLRHINFKHQDKSLNDVLKHLKEQNVLLLRLCNNLSEELLTVQQKKEEIKTKIDSSQHLHQQQQQQQQQSAVTGITATSTGGNHHTNV